MKISIITTTFNSSKTVRDTFESVLMQTYDNIEYIVVDGMSKDSTIDIIKEYEPKFNGKMKWISEPDKGIYDAMNKGFAMASGDVFALINSDDLFCDKNAISKVVNAFVRNPSVDVVYADLYYVSQVDTSNIVRKWVSGPQRPFKSGWHPAHPTFYAKRSMYENFGGFDLDYTIAADFELMLRFTEKGCAKLLYLPEFLVKMRLGGASSKNIKNIISGNKETIRAFNKNNIPCSIFYPFMRILPKLKQFF